jgi:Resolvase, N terminal domain
MSTRVAIYARVSTVNHGQDVTMQTRELRQFAEARGWHFAEEYIDAGVSGTKDSRPELNRLMATSLMYPLRCVLQQVSMLAHSHKRPTRRRKSQRILITRSLEGKYVEGLA